MRRLASPVLACILLLASCTSPISIDTAAGELVLDQVPKRLVSLSATHTEILYAIGAGGSLVATDLTSNYPPEAQATPKVDAFNFNVEEIAAVEPDLVITAFDFQGEVNALEAIGIPVLLLVPAGDLEDAYTQIEVLGRVTGRQPEASDLVSSMRTGIRTLTESKPGQSLSVFHEVDNTLFSANSSTFLGAIYDLFGLANIADAVPDEFGSGYVQLSEEYLFAEDPDLIFLGDASFGESLETVVARPGWETLTAVQRGAVFELDGDIAGRWGPRTVELVAAIAASVEQGR